MNFRAIMFAITTLTPVILLFLGALSGGIWIAAAAAYLTVFAGLVDRFLTKDSDKPGDAEVSDLANYLVISLGVLHFPLLILAVWAVAGADGLALWEKVLAFLAFGLFFGQVSNSNAHELIHRSDNRLRLLGTWVFVSHLFGHHATAHRHIHHRYVGTNADPNSAVLGETYYRFAPRAWWGSFWKGYDYEARTWKQGTKEWWQHAYVTYVGGAVGLCLLVLIFGGQLGLLTYIAFAAYATAQLLLSDYVQHYGLRRKPLPDGKIEPVGDKHSWNAPHVFTDKLMMAAPRHSDHHAHPAKAYITLDIATSDKVPTLPYSLTVMGFIALVPKWWRQVMDIRVMEWMDPDAARRAKAQSKQDTEETMRRVAEKVAETPSPSQAPNRRVEHPLNSGDKAPAGEINAQPKPVSNDADLLAAIRKASTEVGK